MGKGMRWRRRPDTDRDNQSFRWDRRNVTKGQRGTVPTHGSAAEAGVRRSYECFGCLMKWRSTRGYDACPFCHQPGLVRQK